MGDKTTHCGLVVRVASTSTVDGICIVRPGDAVTCPQCKGIFTIVEEEKEYMKVIFQNVQNILHRMFQ